MLIGINHILTRASPVQDAAYVHHQGGPGEECVNDSYRAIPFFGTYCIFCQSLQRSESTDPEFDSNQRSFGEMEKAAEKLLKDAKTFSEAVTCAS